MPRIDKTFERASGNERTLETSDGLNPVDAFVGSRVRGHRIAAGMSEEELGAVIGVTVARVRAYEMGERRIGASLLYEISAALECLPTEFFEDT
jgi:ribosome-binding protein aMBF1 (putative translation factor)